MTANVDDAIARSLVAIVIDAESAAVNDVELFRRIDTIVESYLVTPGSEDQASKRAYLSKLVQEKCDGPFCTKVVAHLLTDDLGLAGDN